MFIARLICTDVDCAFAEEAEVGTLAELEALACDCGCTLDVIGWPDRIVARRPVVVSLPPPQAVLRDAA